MDKTDNNERVFILKKAYKEILRECHSWNGVETGSVIAGAQIPEGFLITRAFAPGPGAKRTPGSFSPDTGHVQKELEAYRTENPGVDFLGIHHQHPGWLTQPSSTDLHQAVEILKDPDYKIRGRLLSLISIRQNGEIKIFPYQITRDDTSFHPIPLHFLDDEDPQVNTLLGQSVFLEPETSTKSSEDISFWDDDFKWYRTPLGRRRLEEDIQAIRMAGAEPRGTKAKDGTLIIAAKRLLVLYPKEYPLNPPLFLRERRKSKLQEICGLHLNGTWNSSRLLAEIIGRRPCRKYLRESYIQKWLDRPRRLGMHKMGTALISLGQYIMKTHSIEKEDDGND